ncbi:MAG: CotH kinase family protein [Kiritimatiellae bacterium]|nr:CotH kinase family protein [Kiritimatiellia bacterium]
MLLVLTAASLCFCNAQLPFINEVVSADNKEFADEDGSFEDWVEIHNPSGQPVSLLNWYLSDDPLLPEKWQFPAVTLSAGGHLLVWASGKERRPPASAPKEPMLLVADNALWRYRDTGQPAPADWTTSAFDDSAWPSGPGMLGYGCPSVATTLSYGGNYWNKHITSYLRHTFNLTLAAGEVKDTGTIKLWVDDGAVVYLNGIEILRVRMPAGAVNYQTPASTLVNSNGGWETFTVSLAALRQGPNLIAAEVHQFNQTSGDLCFWCEVQAMPSDLHTNFKISSGNEPVLLSNPAGELVDTAPAWGVPEGASIGRASDIRTNNWVIFPVPTPGTNNAAFGYIDILEAPQFSVAPGFYEAPISLALSHPQPGVEIYYTTDGSAPTNQVTASCRRYIEAITLTNRTPVANTIAMIRTNPPEMTSNTQYGWLEPAANLSKGNVIRAQAFKVGHYSPQAAAGSWFIGPEILQHSLPVISLISDNTNFFSDAVGLFVPGEIYNNLGWNGHAVGEPNANYFQRGDEWERAVVMQMFDQDRVPIFTQTLGIRNHGGWSRAAAQKTLRVYARSAYGKSALEAQLFPSQSDSRFKRFLLRNSGNDWSSTGLRDMVMQRIFREAARTDTQDGTPAVLYVNGEYWGIQNIREHYSQHYFERKYKVLPENLDFVKAIANSESVEVSSGDDLDYREVLNYIKTHNMADAEHYAWAESRMDLDNMIDHYACEIYCSNNDWPGNNLGLWRERTSFNPAAAPGRDGRWRWAMYDTDHGFGLNGTETTDMMWQARRSGRGLCQPQFDRLLANPDFKNRFVNRFADLINTAFLPARVNTIIDQAAAAVESEIPRHIERWRRMGSLANWRGNIARMKTFANNRPTPALNNIINEFSLQGISELTIDISNGVGVVTCNTITINQQTLGLSNPARPYPWSGRYFKTIPLMLTATADPGFFFSHWQTAHGELPDNPLILTPSNNTAVTAVFQAGVAPRVAINELMADPSAASTTVHPVTGSALDWFELLNEGSTTVDLSGWWLVDDNPANICRIPPGFALAPGEIALVWAASTLPPGLNPDGSLNVTFALGRKGDTITLLMPDQQTVMDSVTFGQQSTDISTARWPNGGAGLWGPAPLPTPALPNCNPLLHSGALPLYPVQNILPEQPFSISLQAQQSVSNPAYSVAAGESGATIDANGIFQWTPPASLPSGLYPFRVLLMGMIDDVAITDETTLLLYLYNSSLFQIDLNASPAIGGAVFGAGVYQQNETVNLAAQAAPLWRFVKWSDGQSSATRQITAMRDVTYTAFFAYGLEIPSGIGATFINGRPLIYWSAQRGAQSYTISRATSPAGPFTTVGTTVDSFLIDQNAPAGTSSYYTVSATAFDTSTQASQPLQPFASGVLRELTGTVIGTLGSYESIPDRTREQVFDKNLETFYDAAADGGWPGLDLGSRHYRYLQKIRYCPRRQHADRMINGEFQLALESDTFNTFDNPILLHRIVQRPPVNTYTTVLIDNNFEFRYFRYLPPPGGWGNIAEAELYGYDAIPATPQGLSLATESDSVTLSWNPVLHANGYLISRTDPLTAQRTLVGYSTESSFSERGLPPEQELTYSLAAVNGSSYSAQSTPASITTDPINVAAFVVSAQGSGVLRQNGTLRLTLSGALDPRLVLICSTTLSTPLANWEAVAAPAFSAPDPIDGKVTILISTNAPTLFFAVRLRE